MLPSPFVSIPAYQMSLMFANAHSPGSASAQTTTDLEDAQAQIQFPSWRSQLLQLIEDVDTLDRMVADRTAGNLADLVTSLRATATDVLPPLNALLAGLRALNASDPGADA